MSRFLLIPGAGGVAWYWHRVARGLRAAGHEAIAVDLPGDDPCQGLKDYRDIALAHFQAGDIVVAQSLGGFTAGAMRGVVEPAAIVFVNAMIPNPGEPAGDWWAAVGASAARTDQAAAQGYSLEFDVETYFLHDVPTDVIAEGERLQREQSDSIFDDPCEFTEWGDTPIWVLVGAHDRFFPADLQSQVALERTGVHADRVSGGHLIALSQPVAVVAYLLQVADESSEKLRT